MLLGGLHAGEALDHGFVKVTGCVQGDIRRRSPPGAPTRIYSSAMPYRLHITALQLEEAAGSVVAKQESR
jgi:hypothetical protein